MAEADPKRRKSLEELIERMENGFDENMLDPLLESIYKEDEKGQPDPEPLPSESKVQPKEKKYRVIKMPGINSGRKSVAAALGSRIGATFSAAAQARRADQEAGGAEKDRFFYLKKAAAFNFGGDAVARTKGRFSKSPQDFQDPALSRDERFTAKVKPFFGADAPQKKEGENLGLGNKISKSIDGLSKAFDDWWTMKGDLTDEVTIEVNNTTEQTKEEIEENNKLQTENNTIQQKLVQVIQKQREDESAAVKEARMEAQQSMTRTMGYSFERDKEEKEEDDGGFNLLDFGLDLLDGGNWLGKGAKVGRRGMGRIVTRTALRLGGKKLAKSAAVKGTQMFVKKAALGIMRPIIKRIPIFGGLIDFAVSLMLGEPIGRAAAKAVGATLGGALGTLIPIPFVGTVAGGILGDMVGGFLYDALTGGAPKDPTNSTPEVKEAAGAPTSFADQSGGLGSLDPEPEPEEKLASGAIIAGEAGPEAIIPLTSSEGRTAVDDAAKVDNSAIAAAPFMLGITRKVISKSGEVAGPIKPFYEQEVAPLERMFGVANFAVGSMLGKGLNRISNAAGKISIGGGGILDGLGSLLGSFFGSPAMAGTMSSGGGFQGATLSGTAAERIGNDPEFLAEVTRVAQKFNIKEGDLLGLMASESGLDPKSDNGTHVGLIQFSADSARAVGTTQAALKSMTRAQQMKYVEKYFDYWKLPQGASAGQLYSVVFAPAYASKDNNAVLYSSPSAAYRNNAPLDADGDGNITVGEMGGRIEKKKAEFGITDSGIRQQPPQPPAQDRLPSAPPPLPNLNGSEHNLTPGPIAPVAFPLSASPVAAPPPVMPLPVINAKSLGHQVIPFNVGGVQGYTVKRQGFEGKMHTDTYDTRGNRYPSFQELHRARLQLQ